MRVEKEKLITIFVLATALFSIAILETSLPVSKIFYTIYALIFSSLCILLLYTNKALNKNSLQGKKIIPVFLILIVSLLVRILIISIHETSYIDEYNHILAGINIAETGSTVELYENKDYLRGLLTSLIASISHTIAPYNFFMFKFTSVLISLLNIFLVFTATNKITKNTKISSLASIFYSISPLILTTSTFIRFYVIHEFFALLLTLILLQMQRTKNISKLFILNFLLGLSLTGLLYVSSNDLGSLPVISLFVFGSTLLLLTSKTKKRSKITILALLLIGATLIALKDGSFLIQQVFGNTVNLLENIRSGPAVKFFFSNLPIMLALLIASLSIKKIRAITLPTTLLMLIHLFSKPDLQVVRGMSYLIGPLAIISFSSLALKDISKINKGLLISALFITTLASLPPNFLNGPYIPNEVSAMQIQGGVNKLKSNPNLKNTTILTNIPQILKANNISGEVIAIRDNQNSLYRKDLLFIKDKTSYYSLTNTPVITSPKDLAELLASKKEIIFVGYTDSNWISERSSLEIRNSLPHGEIINDIEIRNDQ